MPTDDNIYDDVLGEVKRIMLEIRADVHKKYKNAKPFGVKQLTPKEQLSRYLSQGYETFKNLADTQGMDAAIKYRDEMDKLRENWAKRKLGYA